VVRLKDYKYKPTARGKADYYMGIEYFSLLKDFLKELYIMGYYADITLKSRYIIEYYGWLRQLYLFLSVFIKPLEEEKIIKDLNFVQNNVNVVTRQCKQNPRELINILQNIHSKLYIEIQKKKMLLPMSPEKRSLKDIKDAFI